MKANFKKCVTLLMSIVMVFTLFVGTAVAAQPPKDEAMPLAGNVNPVFTSAVVSAVYQSGAILPMANVSWGQGVTQPGFITVESSRLNEFRDPNDPYVGWRIVYTVNAKDATMIQIKDNSKQVLCKKTPSTNEILTMRCNITGGIAWKEELYYDRTVGGYTVYNIEMGGIQVR